MWTGQRRNDRHDGRVNVDRRGVMERVVLASAAMMGLDAASAVAATPAPADGFNGISLLDRLQIMEEVGRYSWAFDSGNIEEYLSRFWADGSLQHPDAAGAPQWSRGHAAIRNRFGRNFADRPTQTYGHQHQFNAIVMDPEGGDVRLRAYIVALRHEFHRQYWPHGPTWRMGTWHALYSQRDRIWRIKELDIRMWTDTALGAGSGSVERPPGSPGTR